MTPFKNRTINPAKRVSVYRNLHKDCYSIKQGSLVVAHADEVSMRDCRMHVGQATRIRVKAAWESGKPKKEVHAWVNGFLGGDERFAAITPRYNPYQMEQFQDSHGNNITGACHIWLPPVNTKK